MCGILIHKKYHIPGYDIEHRGIYSGVLNTEEYFFYHRSLPLMSYTGEGKDFIQPRRINDNLFFLFVGEIFNYQKFGPTKSDIHYLEKFFSGGWNDKLIKEINQWDGFWAIVLVDTLKKEMILFTDPLGKKQLYYTQDGICSEIKPLLSPAYHRKLDYDKEQFGTLNTPINGIYRIIPDHIYKAKLGYSPYVYYKNYFPLRVPVLKTNLFEMMSESVRLRTVNKLDGLTVLVSGGLDSTIILSHLLERGLKPELLTVQNSDDEKYVRILEKYYNVKVQRVEICDEWISTAMDAYEHPIDYGSLLPQFSLLCNASNRVVFTGDGADELLGGYTRALTEDTQIYDIFKELPYYHHIRLDRIGMYFTKEIRQPFLSTDIIKYALSLPWSERRNKKILKETYKGKIPKEILERKKTPLRYGYDSKGLNNQKLKRLFYGSSSNRNQSKPSIESIKIKNDKSNVHVGQTGRNRKGNKKFITKKRK